MEVRVFFWAPIQIQGYDLGFHKNPRKRVFAFPGFKNTPPPPVGASLLAMDVQATHFPRHPSFSFTPIASKLAPTGFIGAFEKQYRLSLLQVFAM
ncbi:MULTISPECIES: hypothetical protein [Pseudomonas]|uniref:hypothetical protein n=1 Tax=Pseudomonas TaxID=286 RepID=UPI0012FF4281|nr:MULTISPECIES: hypothetical protein [Pseudomonas]